LIQKTNKFSRFKIQAVVAFFELIQFFEHCDRQGDIVLVKIIDRVMIMQKDRGVENKDFLGLGLGFWHGPNLHPGALSSLSLGLSFTI
jgi:hypothetical protein